jgi:hypothetical protein
MSDPNVYPKGWDRERVEALIRYYDSLTEDDWIREEEIDWSSEDSFDADEPYVLDANE